LYKTGKVEARFAQNKRRVYVIGSEGAVEVLGQKGPDQYESLGRIRTAPGARTGFFFWSAQETESIPLTEVPV
jgi:hypothetical protein